MAGENNDENILKQTLQLIITAVSDTIKNLEVKTKKPNEKQLLNDFNINIKSLLENELSSLSSQCRNYLLNILHQYNSNDQEKEFTKEMLHSFLHDLQGRLSSLDVFQGAWNGDQSVVKDFIENYPTLKDKTGLYGTTLLYCAARNNHLNLVQYLVEIGKCSVNTQNEEYLEKDQHSTIKATVGSTALHTACFNGYLQIVKYLITHGGDYFLLNNAIETPIQNGQSKGNIKKFFTDFLVFGYSTNFKILPNRTILQEIEQNKDEIIDCVWEYKSFTNDQWLPFSSKLSSQLQQSFTQCKNDVHLKTSEHAYNISITQFLRSGTKNDKTEDFAWIRCRGSSLLNFHCYSQWQMMFIEHPTGIINSSPSIQVFDMTATDIHLNSWYNADTELNFLLEWAMNYRRKYKTINLDFINNEKITFDLENFTFANQQNTVVGFLRWIPKMISNNTKLTLIDNFQSPTDSDFILLTTSRVKQAQLNGNMSTDEINQYEFTYESLIDDDNLDVPNKQTISERDPNKLVNVVQGDLIEEQSDVIVICSSSKHLVETVVKAGGKSIQKSFDSKMKENKKAPVISIRAEGKLASKAVYFVPWHPNSDPSSLCQSIEQLVSNVIEKAVSENYKSVAFPAIGCGEYGCSISLVARTLVRQVQRQIANYPMTILFVIQPDRMEIYDEFQRQVDAFEQTPITKSVSITIEKGTLQVEQGDITKQLVDVIIGSSSSENLRKVLIKAGGNQVQNAYAKEHKNNPNSLLISTPPGNLPCKRIFFLKWEPHKKEEILRQSLIDLIWNVIQNVNSNHFTSIAFPAIGCGKHACSVDIVVKTMIREMKQQITNRRLPWMVKFVIEPEQENVYDEFCKQLLSSDEELQGTFDYKLPSTWKNSKGDKLRFLVSENTEEYKSIITKFDEAMTGNYSVIIKLERIQNERWYMQYLAHTRDFKKRLNENTEKRLYHGCPEDAASLIMEDCFNRSFAGVNGTVYGVGVYFSLNATYSHGYGKPNSNGERCMFVARVLTGKTTLGNGSMKTRPVGFDSTTDGDHIFVTYHDAQAYAEYLITYK